VIVDANAPGSLALAAQAVRAGGLIGLPTETVYGLGADADNAAAVAKIFSAKGRPSEHPLIVHVANASGVNHFAQDVPPFAEKLIAAFWPGPVTLILRRRAGKAAAAAGGQDSIGLRCPSHPVAQALLKSLLLATGAGAPVVHGIAAPSANQFGRVSPTTARHVEAEFGHDLLILDGGACDVGIESTIIDCTRGAPVLLRPGTLTLAQLSAACGQKVLLNEELPAHISRGPKASGTLESHYAPAAKVRLMDAKALQAALDLLGADVDGKNGGKPVIATWSRAILRSRASTILRRRMPDDAAATAQQLFSVLREFDAQGVKLIWIETPPDAPEWDGVRDRLQRASAA
jgi:L-threonylcarbamoyladenylate synthase